MTQIQSKDIIEKIDYLHTQAVAHHKEGNLEEAINFYLESIEIDENQPDWVYGNVIILLAQTGNVAKGLDLKAKAEKIHCDSDNVCVSIAIALDVAQKILKSIEYYQKAISLNQYQPEWVYIKTITNLIAVNKIDDAKSLCILAQKIYPESQKITSTINSIDIIEDEKAETNDNQENNLTNQDYQGYKKEGIRLLNLKRLSEAKLAFQEALKLNSDDIEIYSYLTKISIELKDVIYAELMMHKMLEIEDKKNSTSTIFNVSNAQQETKPKNQNSESQIQTNIQTKFKVQNYIGVLDLAEHLEKNGENIPLQDVRLIADSAFRIKEYSKAAKYYSTYLKNQECSWCRHHLGLCFIKLGNPMEATTQFIEELKVFPDSFWSYHQIREIQYKSGHFDLARAIVKNYYNQSPQNIEKIINKAHIGTNNNYRDLKILPPFLGEMGFEIRHFLGSVESWLKKGWKILAKRPDFYPPGTAIYDESFFKALKEIVNKYAPYGVISLGFGYYIPPQSPIKMGGHLDSDLAPIHTLAADTQALTISKNLERELRSLFAPFLLENKDRPLTIWDQKLLSCTNSVNVNNEWTSFDRYVRYSIPASYKPYHFENPSYRVGEHIGIQLRNIVQQKYEPVQRNSDVEQALKYCKELSEHYSLPIIVYGHPNGTYQPDGYEKTSDNIPVSKLLEKELGYLRSCKLMLAPNSGWCDLMAWLQVPTLIENNVTFDYFSLLEDFSPTMGLINTSLPITKQADSLIYNKSGSKVNLPAHIASAKDISYSDKLEFIVYG
jgi:tetratricopeptide (TPR) repeat protein